MERAPSESWSLLHSSGLLEPTFYYRKSKHIQIVSRERETSGSFVNLVVFISVRMASNFYEINKKKKQKKWEKRTKQKTNNVTTLVEYLPPINVVDDAVGIIGRNSTIGAARHRPGTKNFFFPRSKIEIERSHWSRKDVHQVMEVRVELEERPGRFETIGKLRCELSFIITTRWRLGLLQDGLSDPDPEPPPPLLALLDAVWDGADVELEVELLKLLLLLLPASLARPLLSTATSFW